MVYCTKCGTENLDDADICSNCGASMHVPQSRDRSNNQSTEDMCFGGRSNKMWPLIIGVFIIMLGLSSLLERTYSWARFDNLWPFLIIAVGLMVAYNAIQRR